MKRMISIITLTMILSLTVAGCGASNNNTDSKSGTAQTNVSAANTKDSTSGSATQSSTDAKSRPAKADLTGEVTSISGNQIVLKVVSMPEPGNNMPANGDLKNSSQQNGGQGDAGAPTGQGDQGQPPQGNGQPPQGDSQPPQASLEYTGESKTVTIPDGISITTMVRGDNGGQQETIEVKDIKQGQILQVWYSDKDKGTVSKISVMQSMGKQDSTAN